MTKKLVLVVDDGATNRAFIKTFLTIKNFEVETAEDGLKALQLAKLKKFDLIFSDIEMPNMNGIDFLREVKRIPDYFAVPVIILSSVTKQEVIDETKRLGAVFYMVKPFTKEKMTEALHLAGFD